MCQLGQLAFFSSLPWLVLLLALLFFVNARQTTGAIYFS